MFKLLALTRSSRFVQQHKLKPQTTLLILIINVSKKKNKLLNKDNSGCLFRQANKTQGRLWW